MGGLIVGCITIEGAGEVGGLGSIVDVGINVVGDVGVSYGRLGGNGSWSGMLGMEEFGG